MTSTEGPGPPDDGRPAKRKAGSSPEDANGRQQKRAASAPPPDEAQLERQQQELAEVYSAYDALYRAQQQHEEAAERAAAGNGCVSTAQLDSAFQRLVTAGQQGLHSRGSQAALRMTALSARLRTSPGGQNCAFTLVSVH
jgi:hypothetical protein